MIFLVLILVFSFLYTKKVRMWTKLPRIATEVVKWLPVAYRNKWIRYGSWSCCGTSLSSICGEIIFCLRGLNGTKAQQDQGQLGEQSFPETELCHDGQTSKGCCSLGCSNNWVKGINVTWNLQLQTEWEVLNENTAVVMVVSCLLKICSVSMSYILYLWSLCMVGIKSCFQFSHPMKI